MDILSLDIAVARMLDVRLRRVLRTGFTIHQVSRGNWSAVISAYDAYMKGAGITYTTESDGERFALVFFANGNELGRIWGRYGQRIYCRVRHLHNYIGVWYRNQILDALLP